MRAYFDRCTHGGKYNRNRGYIAVAHQLCLIGYVLWKKDRDDQETPPPRPGSKHLQQEKSDADSKTRVEKQKRKEDDSRPGTGQPQCLMAMRIV